MVSQAKDGRVLRGARNRESIVEAIYELVASGEPMPTAEQVAEQAGVGTRSVFRHFDDMDRLHAELHSRVEREVLPLLEEPLPDAGPDARLRALIERRARVYERLTPFKRSGDLSRWRSPYLARVHAQTARTFRSGLIDALPQVAKGAPHTLEALDLLLSFEAWLRLRDDQRLSVTRARAVLEAAGKALLDAE